MMINLLKNLRLISVIGSCTSVCLLITNLTFMLFTKSTTTSLHNCWMIFFTITFINFLCTVIGYFLHKNLRHFRKATNKKILD